MPRHREFDETAAVQAATEVFWSQGFAATSLRDLLDAMSLSKSSLYETFGSKDRLFERCLDHYADGLVASMQASLAASETGLAFIAEALRGVGAEASGAAKRRGCFVMNTAVEFGQRDANIARMLARHLGRFEEVFARAVERDRSSGAIAATLDVAATAKFLVCNLSGLKTLVKAGASRKAVEQMVDVAMRAVRT